MLHHKVGGEISVLSWDSLIMSVRIYICIATQLGWIVPCATCGGGSKRSGNQKISVTITFWRDKRKDSGDVIYVHWEQKREERKLILSVIYARHCNLYFNWIFCRKMKWSVFHEMRCQPATDDIRTRIFGPVAIRFLE